MTNQPKSQPAPRLVMSSAASSLTPPEYLRAIAKRAFPARGQIDSVALGHTARDTWKALSAAAGVNAAEFAAAIASVLDIEVVQDLSLTDLFVTRLIPETFALQNLLFPIREKDGLLHIAAAYPFAGGGIRRAEFMTDRKLKLYVASPDDLEVAISQGYARAAEKKAGGIGTITVTESGEAVGTPVVISAIVELGQALMVKAIAERASDLHIQPFAGGGMVRVRVDGLLRRIAFISGEVREALLRYVKAQGGMDPTNNRIAQDGRMSLVIGGREYELRLSVLPANRGETLVIRFLDQKRVHHLRNSGFSAAALQVIRRLATSTAGVILVTGPTGSGKSSTLYGMLNEINRVGVNIVTVENPVEYRVAGISQVEVNVKAGLTFASSLRSILRQDPDVILIGEIRDAETAEIAMQAALTGHLVLSTLHTNDALTVIPRLSDLGVQSSVLADALIGIVAQRLFRRLCEKCRAPVTLPLRRDEQVFFDIVNEMPAYRAVGCPACGGSGYYGRFPVAEIVESEPELRKAIGKGVRDLDELRAINPGPLSVMSLSAARHVISGDTTAPEVNRVIGQRFWTDIAREFDRPLPPGALAQMAVDIEADMGVGLLLFSRDVAAVQAWSAAFEDGPFRVHVASDPLEARRIVEKESGIVLNSVDLDAGSPEANQELLKQVRAALAWTLLPTIIIVPKDDGVLRATLEEHHVSDYLVKPVDGSAVASRAESVLSR